MREAYKAPLVELKSGYFFFSDAKMRKVYNSGGFDAQLSVSYPVLEWLHVYGSVEYLQKHGKLLSSHRKTEIWEIPISLGLKPVFSISSQIYYYFTLGPRYFFAHQHNHSPYLDKNKSNNAFGGFVNTGFCFFPIDHFSIDLFGEYSYSQWRFHGDKTNVYGKNGQLGGFTFGLGLGYGF